MHISVSDIPWGIITPLLLLNLILILTALLNCYKAEQTNGPKWMWVLIIIFGNLLGPICYFIIGKKQN
ncbi:Negative regulatory protein YxlE [compost metagenome]